MKDCGPRTVWITEPKNSATSGSRSHRWACLGEVRKRPEGVALRLRITHPRCLEQRVLGFRLRDLASHWVSKGLAITPLVPTHPPATHCFPELVQSKPGHYPLSTPQIHLTLNLANLCWDSSSRIIWTRRT